MSGNPMATHGAASWIEYKGKDTAAARTYYQKVLGWNVVEMPMKDGSSYPGIMVGEAPIGGFSPMPSNGGAWLNYITVDDVDHRFKTAIAEGGTALQDPISIPGVGRMGVFKDPFGATLAVITYEQAAAE
ncbi:MAG: VOC family protein [Pseudomonadota bacterium]